MADNHATPPGPTAAALVDVDSRMSNLIRLSASSIRQQLHMAEAHHSLYPAQELSRRMQMRLARQPELIGAYLPTADQQQLYQQIRRLAASWQLDIPADHILFTQGITEAISLSLRHLTRPGDVVAVETPVYFGLLQTLQTLG
jgi:DNA-binding transcriptional MocR family regulator